MNKKLLLILSTVLSIAFVAAHFFFGCRCRFDNICFSVKLDVGVFIADDDETTIDIFKMNDTHANLADSRISYKKVFESPDGELGYNLPLNIVENNGKIYLLNMKNSFAQYSPSYEICQLDFNRRRMNVIFSFSDEELAQKVRNFLVNEKNTDPESSYFICGKAFGIDNDGIILYFAEKPAGSGGLSPTLSTVYKCKLVGGEFAEAEAVAGYHTGYGGNLWVVGQNVIQFDREYHLLFNGENPPFLSNERYFSFYLADADTIVGRNLDKNEFDIIDIKNKTKNEYQEIRVLTEGAGLNPYDLFDFYTVDGNVPVAVCADGEKNFLFDGASGKKLRSINTETATELILHSVIAVAAAFAVVWSVGVLIRVLRTRGKVSIKFVAAIIPVLFGCDLAAYAAIGIGMNAIGERILHNNLKVVSTQYRSLELLNGIGDFSLGDENVEYQDGVVRFIVTLLNSEILKTEFWTEDSGISANIDFLGYIRSEDKFVNTVDIIFGNNDIDYRSIMPSKTVESITQAIESRSDKYCKVYERDTEQVMLVSPVLFSGDGSVNGVFLFSVSSAEVRYNTRKILSRLLIYMLILSVAIVLLFTLSAVFPLRGLKKLQKKSTDYLSGGFTSGSSGFKDKSVRGYMNEIDVISVKFDELLDSVNEDFTEINNLRRANAAYFSDVILRIFNKKTINLIKFGESASVEAYCIKVLLPEGYSDFEKMNSLLSALGSGLEEHSAFAADIDSTGFSIYSLEPRSVNILFFLREYDSGITAAADKCYIDINIVNIGGSFHFNIRREDDKREKIITDTLINTKSAVVVTENVLNTTRRNDLPAICVGMADNQFIYEISDGVQKRFASSIRDNLKKGVELYFNGDHTAAREMFVMILKLQQDNSVARYYINLLDDKKSWEAMS